MTADQLTPSQQRALAAWKQLAESLKEQLEQSEIYQDWQLALMRVAALEETDDEGGQSSPTNAIIAAVESLLKDRRVFTPVADILQHVTAQGLKVGGKNVTANLSAKIFNSGKFKSERAYGWVFNEFYDDAMKAAQAANVNTAEGVPSANAA